MEDIQSITSLFFFWRNEYVWMSFIAIGFHYICDRCCRIIRFNDSIFY